MAKKNAPTIKDVALAAGVSVGTVSNVINGIAVRKESQRKVQEAIEALHYEVNTYARGLKISKSGLVALIVPNTVNPFYAAFADHIEAALYEHSLKLILCCSDEIPEKELEYLNSAKQNKVDGIIALTYSDIGSHITDGTPIVVFDRFFENRSIPRVGSDNFTGACMAVEKLLELGCRHPGYIRFHSKFPGAPGRLPHPRRGLRPHGLSWLPLHENADGKRLQSSGRRAVDWLRRHRTLWHPRGLRHFHHVPARAAVGPEVR